MKVSISKASEIFGRDISICPICNAQCSLEIINHPVHGKTLYAECSNCEQLDFNTNKTYKYGWFLLCKQQDYSEDP